MEWLDNIKRIKSQLKMTNEELSEASGIPVSTLGKILSAETPSIKLENLFNIANALGVSAAELIGNTTNAYTDEEKQLVDMLRELDARKRRSVFDTVKSEYDKEMARRNSATVFTVEAENTCVIPLYDSPVSAGCGNYLDSDCNRTITMNLNELTERADFAVRVRGDSMLPKYNDGDIVIVEASSSIDEGRVGIFVLNGDSYIKKLGRSALISLNPKYSAIQIGDNDSFECKGLVLGKIRAV